MDDLRSLRRQKFRPRRKFSTVAYLEDQQLHGANLGKREPPLERLRRVDKMRIPSDVHQESEAHPIVCRFRAHHDSVLAIANEDGVVEIVDTSEGVLKSKKSFVPHPSMISDIAWLSSSTLLCATCPPHNQVGIFDVQKGEEIWAKGRLHKGSVKVVARRKDVGEIFASGGRDGDIIVYDSRTQDPVLRIEAAHNKRPVKRAKTKEGYGVTSLNFRDENHLLSTASGGGTVLVWDLRRTYSLVRDPKPFLRLGCGLDDKVGFTYATMCPQRRNLYAQCSDNVIYNFDINTYADKVASIFYGHNAGRGEGAYFIKMDVSPSGKYLAIGSPRMDEFCEEQPIPIFDTQKPGCPVYMLNGHYAEPTCPSWSTDLKLVSCGDDQQLILWEPKCDEGIEKSEYGHCAPFEEKPISGKLRSLDNRFNKPSEVDSTPRMGRSVRNSVSLNDWLKSSPASPLLSPSTRSPLTPVRNLITTPSQKRSLATPSSCSSPQTPKRKKLSTMSCRQITGFFQTTNPSPSRCEKPPTAKKL